MVDNSGEGGEYVLQWEGHAGHVTERFSGLFARQSLVDVTLICEEQRLRVHKLVLASCSLYFEEMLEQDLGQEPTILLSDLNFKVLKAMVEFMYCGETSVSEEHLQPLLQAAKVFKVKELACIAESIMGPQMEAADELQNCTEFPKENNDCLEDGNEYSLFSDNDCVQSSEWNEIEINGYSESELEENSNTQGENLKDLPRYQMPLSLVEIASKSVIKFYTEIPNTAKIHIQRMTRDNETIEGCDAFNDEKDESRPVLCEQRCDFVDIDRNSSECIANNNLLVQSRPEEKGSLDFKEVHRTVDKCLKVYTHKRRKSVEGAEKQFAKIVEDLPEIPISDNCIDLIEEPSKKETELDNDYVLNLSNENVESLVDLVTNEISQDCSYYNNNQIDFKKKPREMGEIFCSNNRIIPNERISDKRIYKSNSLCVPTLRRSVRLSHQENEDSTNNNNINNSVQNVDKTKYLRKESLKRNKNKESQLYYESDENEVSQNSLSKRFNQPRSLRSNSKLIKRRGSKARLSLSKNSNNRAEKTRGNINKPTNVESYESFSNKFNTIATVSRALWGDMSDCLENSENNLDFTDYSQSKEIPFAVGLLPLRAALERMQAMPDYQPRKTRSSVTPFFRQEFNKGIKRKNNMSSTNFVDSNNFKVKRQSSNSGNGNNLSSDTVCHVRITTSHSESVRARRKLINEQVDTAALSPPTIVNRQ